MQPQRFEYLRANALKDMPQILDNLKEDLRIYTGYRNGRTLKGKKGHERLYM